jgi:deoxyribodipyrimidine photo-lyase
MSVVFPMDAPLPTRQAGLKRLEDFLPLVPAYGRERGYDRPSRPTVSGLSPWLQRRLISEEEVCAAVLRRTPWAEAEKFVQEVCWRTYWKGWLEQHPEAWSRYRASLARLHAAAPPEGLERAIAGSTGIPGFDDWARQLVATGWLHNHARMWFASLWIFTLRLPWELGADFFLRHLLDGDPASNTLSWRWVAGLHTAGKSYLARADNIREYSEGRYDPSGRIALAAEPLTEAAPPRLAPLWTPTTSIGAGVEPANDHGVPAASGRIGLWLHPEDLSVEQLDLGVLHPESIWAAWPASVDQGMGWSEAVTRFSQAALADGAARGAARWDATVRAGRIEDGVGAAAREWVRAERIGTVVAIRPMVGPWQEVADQIARALAPDGVSVIWLRRPWDRRHFPAARKGFFSFWSEVGPGLRAGAVSPAR